MTANKLQRILFWAAWLVAAALLGRFAIDFIREMPAWLAVPFVSLVLVTMTVAAMNMLATGKLSQTTQEKAGSPRLANALLLLSVPFGYLTSSLDCTGLSLSGCTPFCTFIKTIWIPALAVVCVAYAIRSSGQLAGVILVMGMVPLAPHCLCFNVGNGWWIDRLGASPTCYAWGYAASLVALSALGRGERVWLSLLVNTAIVGGAMAFFVSHHYFHFPW